MLAGALDAIFPPFYEGLRGYSLWAMRRLTTADLLAGGLGVITLLAGLVLIVTSDGSTAKTVGAVLLGLAGIAFVALAFLIVGESEDRDRGNNAL